MIPTMCKKYLKKEPYEEELIISKGMVL